MSHSKAVVSRGQEPVLLRVKTLAGNVPTPMHWFLSSARCINIVFDVIGISDHNISHEAVKIIDKNARRGFLNCQSDASKSAWDSGLQGNVTVEIPMRASAELTVDKALKILKIKDDKPRVASSCGQYQVNCVFGPGLNS